MMIVSLSVAGTTNPDIVIMNTNSIVKVIYQDDEPCAVRVTIHDEDENLVFKETLRQNYGFIRPYELAELPKGQYKVTVENLLGNEIKERVVTNQPVREDLFVQVKKVEDNNKQDRYLFTVADPDYREMTIQILDEERRVLYSDTKQFGKDDYGCVFVVNDVPDNERLMFYVRSDENTRLVTVD